MNHTNINMDYSYSLPKKNVNWIVCDMCVNLEQNWVKLD